MAKEEKKEEVVIIGGGPAGLSAAIYLGRAGLNPIVINGPQPGGQITTTSELENYPGFPEGIGGFEFMQKVTEQAEKFETRIIYEVVENVDFSEKPYTVETDLSTYTTDSVIIATGAKPRQLGLDREDEFRGNGVSYCATCDGAFYRDKEIAVVGGGDVAIEEANFLTKFGSKVYLIHRRNEFRGTKVLTERVKENDKIEILWDTEVTEIMGEDNVAGIKVENNKTGETNELSEVKGFFVAIGYRPRTDLFKDEIELDKKKYIVTDEKQRTNKEGIYAAGDVQDSEYRQVVTSASTGAKAAMEVDKYLTSLKGDSVYIDDNQ